MLRDLAVSLDNLGDAARAEGDLAGARAAYAESLDLCRRLRALRGDLPEVLRDVAVAAASLNRVAPDAALVAEAREAAESLVRHWPTSEHAAVRDWVLRLAHQD